MHKIGSLKLNGELILAPMADYTNVAFRTLAREYGAALCYTELVSVKAILQGNKKTYKMLRAGESEKPVFLQLFGSEAEEFGRAIALVEKKFPEGFAGYDLNCGCSVPKALKGKYGCSLMDEPQIVGQAIREMKAASEKPVTIKMRLGLKEETFLEVAKEAEDSGADAVTLHPRFGKQGYSGEADWRKIAELKKNVSVPVIGNGDIRTPVDVLRMKKQTKCDFEMVGRTAIGNAFFFRQANGLILGKPAIVKTKKETAVEAKRFLELIGEFSLGANDARPYFIGMAKGFFGAAELRNKFAACKTTSEMKKVLDENFG